ncbi:MAG: UDP-glucose/GDP-mannose dehydrogenase family protein [Methanocalculus sp. MSAO_Arc1]|uniref:UDP-glucose dehydrogenase family protein n=1 Tax=Methanocalculus TaxID=71151 RepID=UPI000FF4F188|nr:UDP-glucose/GDP-mannose dehydrogenase family protein [Methanocalculus sp. MSAO_Arc1]MCP1663232.1 UDPglucose 6-dehydrogenase [Methanocalculus sp. AMF5]RQD80431.1 MAG: UDP-glucose/GDP-mannose dehydrogenase family protein [Methanocalculus sp. MSAO_Arc1]
MNISILGTGYVGAVTGACFAELGNDVVFVDIDPARTDCIRTGRSPIFEPGLDDLLTKNLDRISATTNTRDAIRDTDVTFICVGTPSNPDGSIDLGYVEAACRDIGQVLREKDGWHTVVMKSTVVSGTTTGIVRSTLEDASGKVAFRDFGLAANPEFLREGSALTDVFSPDRIVIGAEDSTSREILESLYGSFDCPKIACAIPVAEMIKYVSNAFLATKISFANEIGNLCKSMGIDTAEVFEGVGLDARINPAFFRSGIGFGGSCFPKDVRALIAQARSQGVPPQILTSVVAVNENQPLRLVILLKKHIPDLRGRRIGVLGLAFKPDTDDIRESRAIPIIEELQKEGAGVIAYDPLAMESFGRLFPDISYADSAEDLVSTADAVLLTTEWKEFDALDYTGKLVIDGRRVPKAAVGSIYEGVCW